MTANAVDPPAPAGASGAGRLTRGRVLGLVLGTLAVVGLVGRYDPFKPTMDALTGGGETQRMQPVHLDAAYADLSYGEKLLESTSRLAPPAEGRKRVLFVGNSQQYTASLPRGATIDTTHEAEVAAPLFGVALEKRAPGAYSIYMAAAPNQNFAEALWQGLHWFQVAEAKPAVLVVQASFDTFRKTGIRPGFQTLLDDPRYVAALDAWSAKDAADKPYLAQFTAAREGFFERRKELAQAAAEKRWTLEGAIRDQMTQHVPLYARRETLKAEMLSIFYLARVHALGITPTTKRHITGAPYKDNLTALRDLTRIARAAGARVLFYNAPVNPDVAMFYEEEYRAYLADLRRIAEAEHAEMADLYDAVPREQWGYWIDGPDPIHFGEQGHKTLAERLDATFGPILAAR